MDIRSFIPNIKCPHCSNPSIVEISGFGSELNNREKICKKCKKIYYVQILVKPTLEKVVADGEIRSYEDRIRYLNKQRKKTLTERLIEHRVAVKVNAEALQMAEEMHRKRQMN